MAAGKRPLPDTSSLLIPALRSDGSKGTNINMKQILRTIFWWFLWFLEPVKQEQRQAADQYSREQFLSFVQKVRWSSITAPSSFLISFPTIQILEAEDMIDVNIINQACDAAEIPSQARQQLVSIVQDSERNRDDVIVLAAALSTTDFISVVSLLFAAFAGETGLLPIRDLIDLHQTVMSFKPKEPLLVAKYGAAIYNQLLSMTFDTTDITFDQFLEMPIVQEYIGKRDK